MSDTTQNSADPIKEVEALLEAELAKEKQANLRTTQIGGGLTLFVAGYLVWITVSIGTLLDPSGLAHAATGFAIDAVPSAGREVRALVVDGAPDLAKVGSDQLVGLIPVYRTALQDELDPVLDEVCMVLAQGAVQELATQAGDPNAKYDGSAALQAGADAAIARVDAILDSSMTLPDDEGITPQQHISVALDQLHKVDAGLKALSKKGADPAERELLLAWLNVIGQHNEAEETALIADYKAEAAAARGNVPLEMAPSGTPPAKGATATVPAEAAPKAP